MGTWWKDLDRILRGEATRLSALRRGTIEVRLGGLSIVLMILAMIYGACMGSFAMLKDGGPSYWQLLASTVKVPALFFLTLIVTFPSLYVFNALVGSRLEVNSVLRLLLASMAVMVAVLSSLGPIVAFFSVSTSTYSFMIVANVVVFAVSGTMGLVFLLQTLHRLSIVPREPAPTEATEWVGETKGETHEPSVPSALDPLEDQVLGRHVKALFRCWVILFGLVGAQMSWVLRPFIGDPGRPFAWFRGRESNFFEAVWSALVSLFS
ncbi:hypothetical protein [Singulisphaera acidiphila]|uniref:Uncharacterized protein n=1 Tax=Singulisphaera acidiphila (strain ATCC BAA-1392 / DSM 18658 / VKM B-2454 / MOB10) TaxID=886293 RepID=L0DFY3_SINAD|nr:hypothetical protein [Singulisphaera acidiphila]AGA27728.1 hypothetical protein Sinac_3471 [Singulisphaera acidiphila DSM 18658]